MALMTEAEWLASKDLSPMKQFLMRQWSLGRLGNEVLPRKVRLFGCACCRRIWHLLKDERSRNAVEVAERCADRLATRKEVRLAREAALAAAEIRDDRGMLKKRDGAAATAHRTTLPSDMEAGWEASAEAAQAAASAGYYALPASARGPIANWYAGIKAEQREQTLLLRDIVGNPFRPWAIAPAWSSWNDSTVVRLAQTIYDERRFADLPILADALEEAGCDNADILDHCRQPGAHARGCWVVDLLLGKQ
jgi:hypothetical protein